MTIVHLNTNKSIAPSIEPNATSKETFTPDTLRKFAGCENYTDEQAKQVIETLEKLGEIVYELGLVEKSISNDNQQVIYLNNQNNKHLKAA